MTDQANNLYRSIILVHEKPYAVWDPDIPGLNVKFLRSFDPEYYSYLADTHLAVLLKECDNEDSDSETVGNATSRRLEAALALRSAYSQGLETLFALLSAAIQAPHCVPAWMLLYRLKDLHKIIDAINKQQDIPHLLKLKAVSWKDIARAVLKPLVLEDDEGESQVKEGFAALWRRFAQDFTNDAFRNEFNSIKHGLRARPGGFSLAIGREDRPGEKAPKERMRLLGSSDFGSAFFTWRSIGDHRREIQLKRSSRNWVPEDIANGLRLISMSLRNLISFLLVANGQPAEQVLFSWPDSLKAFQAPWENQASLGVTSLSGFGLKLPDLLIREQDPNEMRELYARGEVLGRLDLGAFTSNGSNSAD
jgi:hypothetical protein